MQATVVQGRFKHISNYANIIFDLAEWEKALEYLRTDVCHDLMRFLNPLPWLDHKHTKLQWGAQTLYSNLGPNLCKYWNIHVSAGTHLETQHVSHGLQKCIKWQLVNGAHKKSLHFSMSHCFRHFLPDRKILQKKKNISRLTKAHFHQCWNTHTHTHTCSLFNESLCSHSSYRLKRPLVGLF